MISHVKLVFYLDRQKTVKNVPLSALEAFQGSIDRRKLPRGTKEINFFFFYKIFHNDNSVTFYKNSNAIKC